MDTFQMKEIFSSPEPVLSVVQLIFGLLLAFALSAWFARLYQKLHQGLSSSPNFPHSLILISVTACFIMSVVGNSLARAFSLAGALSIVRFRNALKETEDIAAIFLTMSVGIACGSAHFLLASVSTFMIGGFWILLKSGRLGMTPPLFVVLELETAPDLDLLPRLAAQGFTSVRSATMLQTTGSSTEGRVFRVYRLQLENQGLKTIDQLTRAVTSSAEFGFKRLVPDTSLPRQ